MSAPRFFWYYFWIAPHVILTAVAILMVRRKLQREFPFFFAYAIFEVVQFAVTFYLFKASWTTNEQYYLAYRIGKAGSLALRFGAFYEVFRCIFQRYPAL